MTTVEHWCYHQWVEEEIWSQHTDPAASRTPCSFPLWILCFMPLSKDCSENRFILVLPGAPAWTNTSQAAVKCVCIYIILLFSVWGSLKGLTAILLPVKVCGVETFSPPDVLVAQSCLCSTSCASGGMKETGPDVWNRFRSWEGRDAAFIVSSLPFLSKQNKRFCFLPFTNKVTCRSKCPRGSVLHWLEGNQLPCVGFKLPKVVLSQANFTYISICLSPFPASLCLIWRLVGKLLVRRGLALGLWRGWEARGRDARRAVGRVEKHCGPVAQELVLGVS